MAEAKGDAYEALGPAWQAPPTYTLVTEWGDRRIHIQHADFSAKLERGKSSNRTEAPE